MYLILFIDINVEYIKSNDFHGIKMNVDYLFGLSSVSWNIKEIKVYKMKKIGNLSQNNSSIKTLNSLNINIWIYKENLIEFIGKKNKMMY